MSDNAEVPATPMRQRVAEEIRVLLARRRISASELARRMGVTQPYISRRLTGEIALDVDDLERIARALDVIVLRLLPREALQPQTDVTEATTRYPLATEQPTSDVAVQRVRPVSAPPKRRPKVNTSPAGTGPKDTTRRPAMVPRPVRA